MKQDSSSCNQSTHSAVSDDSDSVSSSTDVPPEYIKAGNRHQNVCDERFTVKDLYLEVSCVDCEVKSQI